jgi:hypothetical protein
LHWWVNGISGQFKRKTNLAASHDDAFVFWLEMEGCQMKDEALKLALEKVANALPAYIEGTPAREYLAVIHSALAASVQKGAIGAEYQKSPWDGKGISMPPPEAPVQELTNLQRHEQNVQKFLAAQPAQQEQEPTAKHTDQFESARVGDYNRGWNDCLFASGIVKQPAPVQEPVAGQPLPCPFCGHIGLDFSDGETYRWGVASCGGCGASCGDVRRDYPDQGEWHTEAIAEWNRRSPAAQPAPVQGPDWKAEYLKSVESGCITLDELRETLAELDATNRQVEILSDALAESRREIDAMIALARADERERIKEENQRCYAVRGST